MLPITILVPATEKIPQIFDIRDYKITETVALTGLLYKDMCLSLYKTQSHTESINIEATKMLSYLINPCFIYNTTVYGDCILRIESEQLPPKRQDATNAVLSLMNDTYTSKDKKSIPTDLQEWCQSRERVLKDKLNEMKESNKSTKDIEQALLHLYESVSNYGQKKELHNQ